MKALYQSLNAPPPVLTHMHILAVAELKETQLNITLRVCQDSNMVLCHIHFQLTLLRLLQVMVTLLVVLVWCALLY